MHVRLHCLLIHLSMRHSTPISIVHVVQNVSYREKMPFESMWIILISLGSHVYWSHWSRDLLSGVVRNVNYANTKGEVGAVKPV